MSFLLLLMSLFATCFGNESANVESDLTIEIPPKGNSWVVNNLEENESIIHKNGIRNWTNPKSIIRTYFHTESTGELHLELSANVPNGRSSIKITVGKISHELTMTNNSMERIDAGIFKITKPGYQFIEIEGVEKTSKTFGDVDSFWIGGPVTKGKVTFVKDDFYWGRRGPSVHLNYTTPEGMDILWFYNEITVPKGNDVIGSYFMANGFGEGYFGIQVNSAKEKRILFSVWSPYKTQNPDDIPDEFKIILLGKGVGVTTGEFGNEGSGGQSYKIFDWKAGNTYRFLLKGEPSENNSTDYTAYFFAPEEKEWSLIASFRRPHTHTYLTRPHSFLENFRTETGCMTRMAKYTNQWALAANGGWYELSEAKFTADATARKGARLDYAGGVENDAFFMRNCGFFSDNTTIDSYHKRKVSGAAPSIDFDKLPKIP